MTAFETVLWAPVLVGGYLLVAWAARAGWRKATRAARAHILAYERRRVEERRAVVHTVNQFRDRGLAAMLIGGWFLAMTALAAWPFLVIERAVRGLERTWVDLLRWVFAEDEAERSTSEARLAGRAAMTVLGLGALDEVFDHVDDLVGDGGFDLALDPGAGDEAAPPADWSFHADPAEHGEPSALDGDPRVNEVHGYQREDGTWVDGYWRGDPDENG